MQHIRLHNKNKVASSLKRHPSQIKKILPKRLLHTSLSQTNNTATWPRITVEIIALEGDNTKEIPLLIKEINLECLVDISVIIVIIKKWESDS